MAKGICSLLVYNRNALNSALLLLDTLYGGHQTGETHYRRHSRTMDCVQTRVHTHARACACAQSHSHVQHRFYAIATVVSVAALGIQVKIFLAQLRQRRNVLADLDKDHETDVAKKLKGHRKKHVKTSRQINLLYSSMMVGTMHNLFLGTCDSLRQLCFADWNRGMHSSWCPTKYSPISWLLR